MRGTRFGRLRHSQVTRWGMAAVAAAMVGAAATGSSQLGAGSGSLLAGAHVADEGLRLDGQASAFGGWQVRGAPSWLGPEMDGPEVITPVDFPAGTGPSLPLLPTSPVIDQLDDSGIPEVALRAYVRAEETLASTDPSCGLDWSLLAGIGRVESNHGRFGGAQLRENGYGTQPIRGIPLDGRPGVALIRDTDGGAWDGDAIFDRAVGPMQFIPSSWKLVAADGDGDGKKDPNNIYDAALGAAVYLCNGDRDLRNRADLVEAVFSYNHSNEYVATVLALAAAYASGQAVPLPTPGPAPSPPPPLNVPKPPPVSSGRPPALPDPDDQRVDADVRPPTQSPDPTDDPSPDPTDDPPDDDEPPSDSTDPGDDEPPPDTCDTDEEPSPDPDPDPSPSPTSTTPSNSGSSTPSATSSGTTPSATSSGTTPSSTGSTTTPSGGGETPGPDDGGDDGTTPTPDC